MYRRPLPWMLAFLVSGALSACRPHGGEDGGTLDLATMEDGAGEQPDAVGASCPAPSATDACNASVGRTTPLIACSAGQPCDALGKIVNEPFSVPGCQADGGARLWTDPATGEQRAACVYTPPSASAGSKRPLLVFLHGSMGSADAVYANTSLHAKAVGFDLSGDPQRPGFVLASMQGRNLHWPNPHFEGAHHDFYYRDLSTTSCNPDVRALDRLIDDLVATGTVDAHRIYLSGWSNGANFAQLYSIARHGAPTPGGNRVAAASVYAGADPFDNLTAIQSPSCKLNPYPSITVPLQVVHRACDSLVPCDAAQVAKFQLPPGNVTDWVALLATALPPTDRQEVLLDAAGKPASSCAAINLCSQTLGTDNHLHWPNGVSDGGGIDHEPEMLAFLRAHPLP